MINTSDSRRFNDSELRLTSLELSPTFKRLYADSTIPVGATLALHVEVEGKHRSTYNLHRPTV